MVDQQKLDQFVDWLSKVIRACQGQKLDDDVYQGLMHTNDDRERTKLSTRNVYRHTYLNILSQFGGEEWEIAGKIAEQERHLFIAEEGERATNFINALVHRKEPEQVPVTNITMQNQPPPQPEKKKGFFHR